MGTDGLVFGVHPDLLKKNNLVVLNILLANIFEYEENLRVLLIVNPSN